MIDICDVPVSKVYQPPTFVDQPWPGLERSNLQAEVGWTVARIIQSGIKIFNQPEHRPILDRPNDLRGITKQAITVRREPGQILTVSHTDDVTRDPPENHRHEIPDCGHWPH